MQYITLLILENALLHARHELKSANLFRKYSPHINRYQYDVYYWLKKGWRNVQMECPFEDLAELLRTHVEGGDLTSWWMKGRTRREMVELFDKAIAALPVLEIA